MLVSRSHRSEPAPTHSSEDRTWMAPFSSREDDVSVRDQYQGPAWRRKGRMFGLYRTIFGLSYVNVRLSRVRERHGRSTYEKRDRASGSLVGASRASACAGGASAGHGGSLRKGKRRIGLGTTR